MDSWEKSNMTSSEIILNSIKTIINNEFIKEHQSLEDSDYAEIFKIARSHDILPMVSEGLYKNNLLPANEIGDVFKQSQMTALVRFSRFEQERTKLADIFEKNKIQYIFLKGSEINKYYPENYMRTQCDIDILVKNEELGIVQEIFREQLGYEELEPEPHEVTYVSPMGVHIEVHFVLREEYNDDCDRLLSEVWNNVYLQETSQYQCFIKSEFFLLYHIAHMAKHFINGGCGIKPFVDLWIINHRINVNVEEVKKLLQKCNLYTFYCQVEYLSEVWFGDMTHTEISKKIEDYILNAGVYGTKENHAAMAQCRKGSRAKHLAERIFLPYETISRYYPIVKKYPIILPFAHIYRWCKVLFGKGREQALNEINLNLSIDEEKYRETMNLYKKLRL